jgi:hypothetical protein
MSPAVHMVDVAIIAAPGEEPLKWSMMESASGEATSHGGVANLRDRGEGYGEWLMLPNHDGTHARWAIPLTCSMANLT